MLMDSGEAQGHYVVSLNLCKCDSHSESFECKAYKYSGHTLWIKILLYIWKICLFALY